MIYINIIREETFLFWENKNENREKKIASLVN